MIDFDYSLIAWERWQWQNRVAEVRKMFLSNKRMNTYSNIQTTLKNQIDIDPSMIVEKNIVGTKTKKSGEIENIYESKLNIDFWKENNEPKNIVIDEAHSILNSRRSMSKINVILTDWIALIRRMLGSNDAGHGELVLITQLPNRIDIICRDMATKVSFHKCHYTKACKKCGFAWSENSEMPERSWQCSQCGCYRLLKYDHKIEVWDFANIQTYRAWNEGYNGSKGNRPFYNHYFIMDIEKYFPLYDTLAWDNLFSDLY